MAIKKKKLKLPTIWMTVYGDFITNETLFFMLLFGSVLMALQQGMSKSEYLKFMQNIPSKDASAAKALNLNKKLKMVQEEMPDLEGVITKPISYNELSVTLPGEILFDEGSASLKKNARATLRQVAEAVPVISRIVIRGHTCDLPVNQPDPPGAQEWQIALMRSEGKGPYHSNWELSAARALRIADFLIRERIVAPERIVTAGCGPADPLYPNDSNAHRAKNRRIELRITEEE